MDIHILECRKFHTNRLSSDQVRIVKDYEIDLELGQERIVVIDGVEHPIRKGNVCVRKPGQSVYGIGTLNSILLTIDFSGTQCRDNYIRNVPGPVQPIGSYDLLEHLNGVIVPFSEHTFIPIYTELLNLAFTDRDAAQMLVMELLYKLNAEVCRHSYLTHKPTRTPCSQVLEYLKNNLERDISLEELAQLVHLDKSYLVRLFKDTYGQTPMKLLIILRMEHACDLLTYTNMTVNQIAAACGYASASYFTAEYKRHFGITPLKQRLGK